MKIRSLFSHLPHTLLLCSLSLAVAAAPASAEIELLVLNPANFKQTVSKGIWFIEHFSPYCSHCRAFAPTWKELVEENEAKPDPGIHFAQVNCAVDGDLCVENGVDGYPQMNLYKDGKFVEVFKKPRDIGTLRSYIEAHAEPAPVVEKKPVVDTRIKVDVPAAQPDKVHNPTGTVMVLDETNFAKAIQEGHVFVKFFAPWCGHCKKLAPIWTQLAQEMRGKLTIAEVDCESNSNICRGQGVTGYPMLFYYGQRGHGKTEYTQTRKLEQLKGFAEKISGPAVQAVKYENFDREVSTRPSVFLLVHPESDKRPYNQVLIASEALFGTPPVYSSTEPAFYEKYNLPPSSSVVLVFKDFDPTTPTGMYNLGPNFLETKALSNWLVRNRLPLSLELDTDTFQDIMTAPHKPIVVIAAVPRPKLAGASDRVRNVAQQWKDSLSGDDVIFTWMDSDKWSSWLKSMYGIKVDQNAHIVVANHSRLVYWDTDQFGQEIKLSPSSIISAVNGALSGTTPYKHSQNTIERVAGYIDAKLVTVEHVVSNHPWGVTAFVIGILVGVALFLRRLFSQESALADELARKARLD